MKLEQFEKLVAGRRFGEAKTGQQSGRVLAALRYHLVGGMKVPQAAKRANEVSRQAVYQALKALGVLPRQRVPEQFHRCSKCGQPIPGQRHTQKRRAKPNGHSARSSANR